MRGYPKHLNSRQDVLVAMDIDAIRTRALLQAAVDGREGWRLQGKIESEAAGVTDSTHRVVDKSDDESAAEWYQEEWGVIPGNLLDRIGLTVSEAEELIG